MLSIIIETGFPMGAELNIVNHIRTMRFFAGEMTQQELADRAGVSRQTVIAVEAGKYNPSLELAFRLARALGKRIEEVFECVGDNTNGDREA